MHRENIIEFRRIALAPDSDSWFLERSSSRLSEAVQCNPKSILIMTCSSGISTRALGIKIVFRLGIVTS